MRQVRHGYSPRGRRRYGVGRPRGGDASEGAAALAAPWKKGWPGAGAPVVLGPAPGVRRLLHCVLHGVLCCVLHCVLCCVLHCVLHCVLCLHCMLCCVLHPVVHCVLHPVVHCVLYSVTHCVLHLVVHCVLRSVLAVHVHCRGAVRCALHTVLLVHPGAVHCLLFPVPLHPALPDLPALSALRGGGGGFGTARGAGSPAPLCQQGSRNAAENILQPQCGCPWWGREGGSSVAAGRGGLALRARRDTGTTSRSGEGACRASRRGSSLRARCEGLSGAGSAADAGLARPSHAESALAPAWRSAGASTCRPGARRCGGGACPGAVCPSCPARQHRLIPQPSCRQRRHEGEPCCAHRAPTDPLPSPCRRGRCSSTLGDVPTCGHVVAARPM